ncbi:MAG TPA: hypothetical protein VGM23_03735, partial [Armatimonadota bacterium]
MQRLDRLGYRIAYFDFAGFAQKPAEFLRQFDVVVMLEQPLEVYTAPEKGFGPETEKLHEKIKGFLKDGGGVLIFPMSAYQRGLDVLLGASGVNFLTGAYVDEAPIYDGLGVVRCAYTTDIAKDPRTEGVSGLWHPVAGKTGEAIDRGSLWNANTIPFDVDAKWTVLASGSAATTFVPFGVKEGVSGTWQRQPRLTTMTRNRVPLVAAREGVEGNGRLAVCAIDMAMTDFCAGNTVYNGLCTGKGLEGKRSDLDRLLLNVVDWLGQGSQQTGRPTIAASVKESIDVPPFSYAPLMAVSKNRPFLPNPDQFTGFVGARSTYSGGKSTVAEYAKAARELGLQYLVFL